MEKQFPKFSLVRLLTTVFQPQANERVAILIDLDNPADIKDLAFLSNPDLTIQRHAYNDFYTTLKDSALQALNLQGGDLYAYQTTGGSNLDLPDTAFDVQGNELNLVDEILSRYDIVLCISTYSATAPLTAIAKRVGFRGATLHGVNDIILNSGLAVDYEEVSRQAEKLRLALTQADHFEIDYQVLGKNLTLQIVCNQQEAQKSHGLCRGKTPDIANLPAGEVYFVPSSASGQFPLRYEDGSIGIMNVKDGRIQAATFLQGNEQTIREHNEKLSADPVTGVLGELGFGTQDLPVSGRDIQDEKILGTMHVATGRSDHLGGHLTPDLFAQKKNATHDDILFSPSKTPEILVSQVRMTRAGQTIPVLENYKPAAHLQSALAK